MEKKEELMTKINTNGMSAEDMVKMLAGSMIVKNEENDKRFLKLEAKYEIMQEQFEKHDKAIMKQITLTTREKTAVSSNVKSRAKQLCRQFNLEEDIFIGRVISRIYSCLKQKYSVSSYMEIPSFFFDDAIIYIQAEPIDCSNIRRRYIKELQHKEKYKNIAGIED